MLYLNSVTEATTENYVEAHINEKSTLLQTSLTFIACNCIYHCNELTSLDSFWYMFSNSNPKKVLLFVWFWEPFHEWVFSGDGSIDSWLQTLTAPFPQHLSSMCPASDSSVVLRWRVTAEAGSDRASANTQYVYCACNESPQRENVCHARLYRGFVKINIPIED